MALIHFKKQALKQADVLFKKEYLEANSCGAYSSSTIANCHTRKYHGSLIVRQPQVNEKSYVLLSQLDEVVQFEGQEFELSAHQFPEVVNPKGYQLLSEFSLEKIPAWIYKINDVNLMKELLLVEDENQLLIRYTLKKGKSIKLKLSPFAAFREIDKLTCQNDAASKYAARIRKGIAYKMYDGFDALNLQLSNKNTFEFNPTWFLNFQYEVEKDRGYDFQEDTLLLGAFDTELKNGESVVFSASTKSSNPKELESLFDKELKKKIKVIDLDSGLLRSANQFISKTERGTEVCAGFHWFGRWGRDTFIALPGLTLSTGKPDVCKAAIDTMLKDLKGGLLTNTGIGNEVRYNSADASLWLFWTLQMYTQEIGSNKSIWPEYSEKLKEILYAYRDGTMYNIHMQEDGLLYGGQEHVALTWMDAMVDNRPVTPRSGNAVDLNALWYNAIGFAISCAKNAKDDAFVEEWKDTFAQIKKSFNASFWEDEKGYLADSIEGVTKDWSLRPNQLLAISLPNELVSKKQAKQIVKKVKNELLTPVGLRTLSPNDVNYIAEYEGDQRKRDNSYHQGIVWPWLLGPFCEAYLKSFGSASRSFIKEIYDNFAPAMNEYGLGSVAEIYNAEFPYSPVGTISQAWSVSELLRIKKLIE